MAFSNMPRYSDGEKGYTRPRRSEKRRDFNSSTSNSRSPSPHARPKSIRERALTTLGLRAANLISKTNHRDPDQNRSTPRRRDRSSSPSQSRSRGPRLESNDTREQVVQSAKSALLAGVGEAFRSRKEPEGSKRKRVLTAAVSAGAINVLLNQGDGRKDEQRGGRVKVAESVVGGLAVNYLVHGSRHKDRSRSRSHSRGRVDGGGEGRDVAGQADRGSATAAANGNNSRDRSRQSRSPDPNSDGGKGKRGKGVGGLARAGMAKLGLGGKKS